MVSGECQKSPLDIMAGMRGACVVLAKGVGAGCVHRSERLRWQAAAACSIAGGAGAEGRGGAAQQWWHSCVAAGNSFHRAAMLGKLDMVERVSLGRDSHEMVPLSPRIMPRAAAPRAPLYEENEEESVLERGLVRGAGE